MGQYSWPILSTIYSICTWSINIQSKELMWSFSFFVLFIKYILTLYIDFNACGLCKCNGCWSVLNGYWVYCLHLHCCGLERIMSGVLLSEWKSIVRKVSSLSEGGYGTLSLYSFPFTTANTIPRLVEMNQVCCFYFPVLQWLYCIYSSDMPTLYLSARHHHTCFQPQASSRVSQARKMPNKKTFVLETKPYLERSVSCHCSRRTVRHEGIFLMSFD